MISHGNSNSNSNNLKTRRMRTTPQAWRSSRSTSGSSSSSSKSMFLAICSLLVAFPIVSFYYEGSSSMVLAFTPIRIVNTGGHSQNSFSEEGSRWDDSSALICAASGKKDNGDDGQEDWFQQKRGESDVAFIKRITSNTPPAPKSKLPTTKSTTDAGTTSSSAAGYQRIEDWEAEQEAARKNGTLSWEEKVQFDGQRFGNQLKQNDILIRQINSGF